MIVKLSGTLTDKAPTEITIDVGGVGYQIFIPLSVFYRLPDLGARVSLYTHTHVREDALQLFGFLGPEEKQVFLLLNGVSGIGPKLAVNILSGIPAEDLAKALREGDQPRLLSIPGVGKKLAERMIVELKDKFATLTPASIDSTAKPEASSQMMQDAVSALINLGYKKPEIEKMVREVLKNGELTLEEVLRETLRHMSH